MDVSREEMSTDIEKVKFRKRSYLTASIVLLALAVLLVAIYFVGPGERRFDWGALALAGVGIVFSILMFNQFRHMRELEVVIRQRLAAENGETLADWPTGEEVHEKPRLHEVPTPTGSLEDEPDENDPGDEDAPGYGDDDDGSAGGGGGATGGTGGGEAPGR